MLSRARELSEDHRGAARELRSAAIEALRGIALMESNDPRSWPETKVIVTAMESDAEIARLLQIDDRAHILLRVSMEGAVLTADDLQPAHDVTAALLEMLRQRVTAATTHQ